MLFRQSTVTLSVKLFVFLRNLCKDMDLLSFPGSNFCGVPFEEGYAKRLCFKKFTPGVHTVLFYTFQAASPEMMMHSLTFAS